MRRIKVFLLFCACLLLVGCAREKDEAEKVSVTLIHGWGGNLKTHRIMQEIYNGFAEENPDIEMDFQPSSDGSIAVEKVNDMLAVGRMPDIVSTNGYSYYVENAVKQGMALDLMPYIEEDAELKAEISPAVFEAWEKDGKIYTLPDAMEVMGYWYNEDIFRKAGVTDGSGNVALPKTWDEFFADCEKIQGWSEENGGGVSVMTLNEDQTVENFFFARLAGAGEEGLAMTRGLPKDFDTPAMKRTVEDLGRLYTFSHDTDNIDNARQYFLEGKSAVYFNGVWESEIFSGTDIEADIGYAAYPSEDGRSIAYISPSSGYVVYDSPDERKKEADIRFLKYILSDEVQTKIALETGQAPSNPNVESDAISHKYPLLGEGLETAREADIHIKSMRSVWNGACGDILVSGLQQASLDPGKYSELTARLRDAASDGAQ